MEWVLGIFLVVMLMLLVYSIVSTSMAIRKKAQPTIDRMFEAIHIVVFGRRAGSRQDQLDDRPKTK